MASLTSEKRNGKDIYRIEFRIDGVKKKIGLRSLNKKSREAVLHNVDEIISHKASGKPFPESLINWIQARDRWLIQAIAKTGLIEAPDDSTWISYIDDYITSRKDNQSNAWYQNHRSFRKACLRYFGGEILMRDITPDRAADFRRWLEVEGKLVGPKGNKRSAPYAQATISTFIKKCKTVCQRAVKAKLIYSNPFDDVVAGEDDNPERNFEVTEAMTQKVIDLAPNAQWRLLIALVRFGGLRTGSETRALKWSNVDFVNNTIDVPGSKGAKRNSNGTKKIRWRTIPMFERLRPYLEDAFDPENEFCLQGIVGTDSNVYRHFKRLVIKAGMDPWPRLWHNLRAGLDSDLSAQGVPEYAVNQIMGNTMRVSRKHYKYITSDLHALLVGTKVGTQVPETTDSDGNEPQRIQLFPGIYVYPEEFAMAKHPEQDSNLRPID